ncbi:MAG: hypothetical protein AB7S36_20120, partial [Planctomycetota bacterium]
MPAPMAMADDGSEQIRRMQVQRRRAGAAGAVADGADGTTVDDTLAVEEPLEIRLVHGPARDSASISITMRTPGHDASLAV